MMIADDIIEDARSFDNEEKDGDEYNLDSSLA